MFYYPSSDWRKENKLNQENLSEDDPTKGGWNASAVRRFINKVGGEEVIDDLFKLRIADAASNPKSEFNPIEIKALEKRIADVRAEDMILKVADLAIDGNVLMELGFVPGPEIGQILDFLLDKVIDKPELNTAEDLIELVKTYKVK